MKFFRKSFLPLVFALAILLSALILTVSAETNVTNAKIASVVMNVGADETERNLVWFSDVEARAEVQYAEGTTSGAFPSSYQTAKAVAVKAVSIGNYSYKTTMVGLETGKSYVYRIVVGETVSQTYTFTVKGTAEKLTFAYITDAQVNNSASSAKWSGTLNAIVNNHPDTAMILSGGDQVMDTKENYFSYFIKPHMTYLPIATTVGPVHDTSPSTVDHFNLPNLSSTYGISATGADYFFTYQNVLVMDLNMENTDYDGHVAFMENAIAAHPDCPWRIVVVHASFFSGGDHSSGVAGIRNALAGEFNRLGVDLVLSGHDHVYARSNLMMDATTVSSDVVTNNTVTDPEGTLYICGMSAASVYYDYYDESYAPYIAARNEENRPSMMIFEVTDTELSMRAFFTDTLAPEEIDNFTIHKTKTETAPTPKGYEITFVTDPDATFGDATDLSKFSARLYTTETPDAPAIYMPKGSIAEGKLNRWSWSYYTTDGTPVDSFEVGERYLAYLESDPIETNGTIYIGNATSPETSTYTWADAFALLQENNGEHFTVILTSDLTLTANDKISIGVPLTTTLDLGGYRLDTSAVNPAINFSFGSSGSNFSVVSSKENGTVNALGQSIFYLDTNSSGVVDIHLEGITVESCGYLFTTGGNFKHGSTLNLSVTGGTYASSSAVGRIVDAGTNHYNFSFKDATMVFGATFANAGSRATSTSGTFSAEGCTFRYASARPFQNSTWYQGPMTFTDCTFDGVTFPKEQFSATKSIAFGEGCTFKNSEASFKEASLAFAIPTATIPSDCVVARIDGEGTAKVVKSSETVNITWQNPVGYTEPWLIGATPKYCGPSTLYAGDAAYTLVMIGETTAATADATYTFKTAEGYLFLYNETEGLWQISYDGGVSYENLPGQKFAFAFVDENGNYDYKGAIQFTPANVSGKKVVLFDNLTASGALANVTIDLNGYTLTAETTLFSGTCYVYNAATEPATIIANCLATGNQKLNLGYEVQGKKASGRITVVSRANGLLAGMTRGTTHTFSNVDFLHSAASGSAAADSLFGQFQYTVKLTFENCNFYFSKFTRLIGSNKIISSNIAFTGCQFFFKAGGSLGGRNDNRNDGANKMSLHDTDIYGAFDYCYSNCWSFEFSEGCQVSALVPDGIAYTVSDGCVFATKPSTVEVNVAGFEGTYRADYLVMKQTASTTVTVYDKAFGTEGGSVVDTLEVYTGSVPVFPSAGSYQIGNALYQPTGDYAIYKGEELIYTGPAMAFTEELIAAGPYEAYPVVALARFAFAIVNGTELIYKAASDFTAENVSGKTVVLLDDITVTETLADVTIDLNGKTLRANTTLFSGTCYVYNAAADPATIITNSLATGNQKLNLGYEAAGKKASGRITVVSSANGLLAGMTRGTTYTFSNVDFAHSAASGAKATDTFLGQFQYTVNLTFENCNFYFDRFTRIIGSNKIINATITFTDCQLFFAAGGTFNGRNDNRNDGGSKMVLRNTDVYGAFDYCYEGGGISNCYTFAFENGCHLATMAPAGISVTYADGNRLLPANAVENVTFSYTKADGTVAVFEGSFTATQKVGDASDLKAFYATFYRNVSLDVNINFNLYIPTDYALAGNYETTVIGGKTYYVVTVKTAPKDATGDNFILLTIGGIECEYNASLVSYAKALLNLAPTTDYVKDSQTMVQYVLHYVKSTAQNAYGEVDTAAIDTLLAGFALDEEDKKLENVQTNAPITGIVGATLDLNSTVGIVFCVEKGYRGALTVTFNGKTTTYDYTASAAGDEEYIVIDGIEAFRFANNVVVENSEGETFLYNVATYVENKKTEVGYAAYAYAKAAYDYHVRHGAPTTVN